jgi:hypothetical protein
MSAANIIAAISATIAAGSLLVTFLQYRASRIRSRTETSRRVAQYQHLIELATRAAAQAETAKLIVNSTARGLPGNIEDLRVLSGESAKLAEELSAEAEYSRPATSLRRYRSFSR